MRGWPADADGYAGSLSCAHEVTAVAGDCFAVTSNRLSDLGGFNPYFASEYHQAVDLSIRASASGLRNLFTPRVIVLHSTKTYAKARDTALDTLLLADVWEPIIKRGDPFHNRNFRQVAPGYLT
jgi:GT2 family glycosyltransferase